MFQKIIFTFLSLLALFSCKRVDDKSKTKIEPSEELKVEIINEEIIEDPKNDLKLTDESLKTDIENVEHNVSMWAEKEFKKLYDIINQGNPLGQ